MPYSRHQPELTVLHQVVRKHLGEFQRTLKEEAGAVPAFITRTWRSYMDYGLWGSGLRAAAVRILPSRPCHLFLVQDAETLPLHVRDAHWWTVRRTLWTACFPT
jgi:hypothetical protein